MNRDKLLSKICPMSGVYDCCMADGDYDYDHCEVKLNEWLDEYDKQIRADAIDDFVHKVKEHHYLLSDVINSTDYGMFTVGIEQIAKELKEGNKE